MCAKSLGTVGDFGVVSLIPISDVICAHPDDFCSALAISGESNLDVVTVQAVSTGDSFHDEDSSKRYYVQR
ncbi:hypothetical protein GOP47_0006194 [Adiantum capillus-veneris]|uniref:Uncharacterized protein n=1 Tax=Adiantum capillus-veneris TaxID=13818 RepID=A0A9D4V2L6_ADICA|nr:hypothetical protein GOP47_0030526 [Adiantum capillus-veneris]KAI5078523.1 hypothetical protein GOP47_0006194 [Adiantum capillus-veneris]